MATNLGSLIRAINACGAGASAAGVPGNDLSRAGNRCVPRRPCFLTKRTIAGKAGDIFVEHRL
jgi:hypothetical protein